jgi:Skp family chaperone for outer membrane proteins
MMNYFFDPTDPTQVYYNPLPDNATKEELEQYQRLTLKMLIHGIVMFLAALLLMALVSLFTSCAAPKAIDRAEHHHAAIDTLSIQAAVDAHMTSWHERMDSFFRERVSQSSSEQHSSTDQKELITETVTTTTDSLGRSIRQEQRTISRDLHQEQQQLALRLEREMENRLQTALDLQDSIWQQRLDAALSHREQTDSTHNTVTPAAQDNRPWYRRWADRLQWLIIGVVFAAALWITRRWWLGVFRR